MTYRIAVVCAAVLLGAGLGGVIEGTLFRSIVRWHDMFAFPVVPSDAFAMQASLLWDASFHAVTLLLCMLGVGLLWIGGHRTMRAVTSTAFGGAMMFGWGLFNIVVGTFDHPILGMHHVHTGASQLGWNFGFFMVGAVQLVGGAALVNVMQPRRRRHPVTVRSLRAPAHGF